jgi:hypothetical protein
MATGAATGASSEVNLMTGSQAYEHRKPLERIVARYDRLARFYRRLEFLFLITPHARRKAVSALELAGSTPSCKGVAIHSQFALTSERARTWVRRIAA